MRIPANRSVVVISGLLTLLVLGGGTLAVAFHNGWLRTASDSPTRETAVASAQQNPSGDPSEAAAQLTQPSAAAPTQDETGVYRQKLEQPHLLAWATIERQRLILGEHAERALLEQEMAAQRGRDRHSPLLRRLGPGSHLGQTVEIEGEPDIRERVPLELFDHDPALTGRAWPVGRRAGG